MKRFLGFSLLVVFIIPTIGYADSAFLNAEENLWLKSRNSTIVVYPEKNFPPYSYQNSSGTPQGLSIDYIELISKKIGAKVEYLPARSRSQIIDDVRQSKKGDVVLSLTDTKEKENILYFSDTYVSAPAVIVVRKDSDIKSGITLNDLSGKKVAIGKDYAVEEFVRVNNPRIVIEQVTDDESGLQQVVLGEVEAAVMDISSLSYYLSKQVLNSVKVVGNTGFEYKLAFAVPKNKEILQSILDKGLQQISINDRALLNEKWIVLPGDSDLGKNSWFTNITNSFGVIPLYILLILVIGLLILLLRRKRNYFRSQYKARMDTKEELRQEIAEFESVSAGLVEELKDVKALESDIKEKLKTIDSQ